jgi:hypothetical protein
MAESQQNPDKPNRPEEARSKPDRFVSKKRSKSFFKIAGLFFVSACLYILIFIYSEPTIDTDYLAQLNQINKPPNYKEEDNAWPLYQKAFELYVNNYDAGDVNDVIFSMPLKKFSELNKSEQKIVINWLDKNQNAWDELVKAIQKPYCYIEYEIRKSENEYPFESLMPKLNDPNSKNGSQYLSSLKMLAYLGQKRIEMEIENKNTDQAIEDCLTLLAIEPQWQKGKFFLMNLVPGYLILLGLKGC